MKPRGLSATVLQRWLPRKHLATPILRLSRWSNPKTCRGLSTAFTSNSTTTTSSMKRKTAGQAHIGKMKPKPKAKTVVMPPEHAETLKKLDQALQERNATEALRLFEMLRMPPTQLTAQRVVILLAKAPDATDLPRAIEILTTIFMMPLFQPDDYTKLAVIYVSETCLQHKMLDQALETVNMAASANVVIDLPALDRVVRALVHADRLDEAAQLVRNMSANHEVSPTERIYFPLLAALVQRQDYLTATFLLEFARKHGSKFTSETFHPLVEMAESDEDTADALESFLSCIERMWEAVKTLEALEEDLGDDEDESQV